MDKYSAGLAVTENTSFPKCRALMINNSTNRPQSCVLHYYVSGSAGVTAATNFQMESFVTKVLNLQCRSIGAASDPLVTVNALY